MCGFLPVLNVIQMSLIQYDSWALKKSVTFIKFSDASDENANLGKHEFPWILITFALNRLAMC